MKTKKQPMKTKKQPTKSRKRRRGLPLPWSVIQRTLETVGLAFSRCSLDSPHTIKFIQDLYILAFSHGEIATATTILESGKDGLSSQSELTRKAFECRQAGAMAVEQLHQIVGQFVTHLVKAHEGKGACPAFGAPIPSTPPPKSEAN